MITLPVVVSHGELMMLQDKARRLASLRSALDGQRDEQYVPVGWVRAHLNGTVDE